MASKSANYEIQVMKDGRWCTQSYLGAEDEAVASAKRYLNDKKCEGARVVHNWARSDGRIVEKEIFAQTRTVKDDGPVRIVEVDSAPPKCEMPDDYYGPQSRNLMNRIFRNYMEKQFLTPTELIHNYKELKRIQDKDTLVPSAVDRVAFLQTRDGGQDTKGRRDEIYKSVDAMSARARRAESLQLPRINGSFKSVVDAVAALDGEDTDYLARVVLARDLLNARNWLGKLDRLCRLAVQEGDSHALDLLDGVIADVLGSNVVQEILGFQPSLAAAIGRMFDLAEGNLPTEKSEAGESAELLNALLRDGKLPLSRAVLVDRAIKQIKSANPLYRNDPAKERDAFVSLVGRMITTDGLLFGAEAADALTWRAARMMDEGGAAGRRGGIQLCFTSMPDRAFGLIYLCDLARTEYAKEHAPDIMALLNRVLDCRSLGELTARDLTPKDRMIRATLAHRVAVASVFPPDLRKRMADTIDVILERYLVTEQVIEKLDHHESPLRDRAVRLVQFCAAGVMPEGKAMTRARERIVGILKTPNFDARFIDGIDDPGRAQKALRDFHQLLVRAGFGK